MLETGLRRAPKKSVVSSAFSVQCLARIDSSSLLSESVFQMTKSFRSQVQQSRST